jgi:hypothetical protein
LHDPLLARDRFSFAEPMGGAMTTASDIYLPSPQILRFRLERIEPRYRSQYKDAVIRV